MQTAQARQQYTKNGEPVSLATCIETLYFEQQYNGQVYRTSLNNRLLVVGNKLNAISKNSISNALNMAQLPFYYITKIESDTASGLYRLDVSLWNIDSAVRATQIIDELNTSINTVNANLSALFLQSQEDLKQFETRCASTYVPILGGKMQGGIVFGQKNDTKKIKELPGIGYNGENLVIACPSQGLISFWGSLSEEYGTNTPGITWKMPTVYENGKVPVFNYSNSQLVWSTYNAGSLQYSTADYGKYYILGITEQSYQERDFGETTFIAKEGNIETNVYVSRKNVYANAFYASSDIALKTNIKHIDSSTYIPDVIQFRWLDTSEISYGFIAQDLENHGLSYLMDKDDQDHWRVNYNAAIALVVGDLQSSKKDHEKRISELEKENNELKETVKNILKKLEKIEINN